jgi:hypothetical protein
MKQRIVVQKEYRGEHGDLTVLGVMELDAATPEAAVELFNDLLYNRDNPLQTTDPRIKWDYELDALYDDDYEYVDFTFDVLPNMDPDDVDAEHSH